MARIVAPPLRFGYVSWRAARLRKIRCPMPPVWVYNCRHSSSLFAANAARQPNLSAQALRVKGDTNMKKRIVFPLGFPIGFALAVLLMAGGFSVVAANGTYNVPGRWFGLITDTKDVNLGPNVTADKVRAGVAAGGRYVLINSFFASRYILLTPADKVAPYAGQTAFVSGVITTHSLLKGNAVLADSDGGGGSGERNFTMAVSGVEPHAETPYYITAPSAGGGE